MDANNNPLPNTGPAPSPAPQPAVPPVATPGGASQASGVPTANPLASPTEGAADTLSQAVDANTSNTMPGVVPPAAPIAHPTNIDGFNPVAPSRPVADSTSSALNSLVEQGSAPTGATPMSGAMEKEASAPASNPFSASSEAMQASTPNVSFTDPATQPEVNPMSAGIQTAEPAKKKSNKKVLMALSIIAFIVAAALAAVLVMELTGTGLFGQ